MPAMARHDSQQQRCVDTVIIGNGPSALLLSYILHGHIPYYKGGHHDRLIDHQLGQSPNLLAITPGLYNHLASSVRYTSQALPVNTLLDTLILPYGEADFEAESCVEWRYDQDKVVSHVVLGNASRAGGQWADNPVNVGQDIGTLSYSEQLNLPGYSFSDHWLATKNEPLPELIRPTRKEVAAYFAAYPAAVAIENSIQLSTNVSRVSRIRNGFRVSPQNIECKHLVLATGIFNLVVPPPPLLRPLTTISGEDGPLLIIGSGFTAADIIISTPAHRKIIHIFNWDPENRPSPLKACHHRAYPEYAYIYRQMTYAAQVKAPSTARFINVEPPTKPKGFKTQFEGFAKRDWFATYEGFPNSRVIQILALNGQSPQAKVNIGRSSTGDTLDREIDSFYYAAGRRGSLSYLAPSLLHEILPEQTHLLLNPDIADITAEQSEYQRPSLPAVVESPSVELSENPTFLHHSLHAPDEDKITSSRRSSEDHDFAFEPAGLPTMISGQSLRFKIEEAAHDESANNASGLELANDVFVIGSLTGDSLVRFACGGCAVVAGKIMGIRSPSMTTNVRMNPRLASALSNTKATGSAAQPSADSQHHGVNYVGQNEPILDQLDRKKQQDRDNEQLIQPQGIVRSFAYHSSPSPKGDTQIKTVSGGTSLPEQQNQLDQQQQQKSRKKLWRSYRPKSDNMKEPKGNEKCTVS